MASKPVVRETGTSPGGRVPSRCPRGEHAVEGDPGIRVDNEEHGVQDPYHLRYCAQTYKFRQGSLTRPHGLKSSFSVLYNREGEGNHGDRGAAR